MEFAGRRRGIFWLALKTGFLTVITLGFYRFWMKTRMRQWYWSAIRPGGHPLEYVGDPLEKLLGFFIAVVILTFYIGIINLLLMFVSFSIFSSSLVGYAASFAGVIPLWFYARYRARRYVLARTRWRGVRFALAPGAWGYAGRALLHWTLTILTLGILWPRMTFLLEKYKTDRTFFGSACLHQGGRWQMLYRSARPVIFVLFATLAWGLWVFVLVPILPAEDLDLERIMNQTFPATSGNNLDWNAPERLWCIPVLIFGLLFAAIYYRWDAKRLMANHKVAPGIRFRSLLSGGRVMMIYIFGNVLSYFVLLTGLGLFIFLAISTLGPGVFDVQFGDDNALAALPQWVSIVLLAMLYLSVFLLWNVLHNAFVIFPLMRHMAVTTSLPDTSGLDLISQRDRDAADQAEGFAEALDLGAAI